MRGTSFGNYEFKAVDNGVDPFYGILLLNFKGDHLAAAIIFFRNWRVFQSAHGVPVLRD